MNLRNRSSMVCLYHMLFTLCLGPIEQVDDRNPMHPPPPKEHPKTQSRRPSKRPAPKVQPSTFDGIIN